MSKGWIARVAVGIIVLAGIAVPAADRGTPLALAAGKKPVTTSNRQASRAKPVPQARRGVGGIDRLIVLVTARMAKIKIKQMVQELKAGKTVAQVATEHKVSLTALRAAILKTASTRLALRVSRGMMTKQEEKVFLARIQSNLPHLLNQKFTNVQAHKSAAKKAKKPAKPKH